MIDLSMLTWDRKIAVNCVTEEEALTFVKEVKHQFPDAARDWITDDIRYNRYGKDYCLTLFNTRGIKDRRLTYCNKDYFKREKYDLILFKDLKDIDFGEFDAGQLGMLFEVNCL